MIALEQLGDSPERDQKPQTQPSNPNLDTSITIRNAHQRRRSRPQPGPKATGEHVVPYCWRATINYYGAFYRSELSFLARRINEHLVQWAMHKFKRLKRSPTRAWAWFNAVIQREPLLFAHWGLVSPTRSRPVIAAYFNFATKRER